MIRLSDDRKQKLIQIGAINETENLREAEPFLASEFS
jgi:hypothetical protein